MSSALLRARLLAVSLTLLSANSLVIPVYAGTTKDKSAAPAGTMMIHLEPRMDDRYNSSPHLPPVVKMPAPAPAPAPAPKTAPARKAAAPAAPAAPRQLATKGPITPLTTPAAQIDEATVTKSDTNEPAAPFAPGVQTPHEDHTAGAPVGPLQGGAQTAEAAEAAEAAAMEALGGEALDPIVDENSLLKGTVQIVADDTEYDQEKNTFLGTGNAVAVIAGQNSRLEADTILYDQNSQTIDARGNVKIVRDGQLTTGSSFKFKIDSDEYLITNPDTELQGTQVIARSATGNREGLAFKNATFTLPKPVVITNQPAAAPLSMQERIFEMRRNADAYLPAKPSFKFTARKMVYEKYKDAGNLTVFGGKLKFDNFTVPIPKFEATVSNDTRVVFPVTPFVGNNMNVGGINMGPLFNYAVGKTGVFSWGPLLQIGGRSVYDLDQTRNNTGKLGAGARIGYTSEKLQAHLAYGSVSNLMVADFKYRWNKHTKLQAGVNRFMEDGLMGMRRPRLGAEIVDTRYITHLPYISMISFRSSGGAFQDQPQLVTLQGSQYSDLFNTQGKTTKTSGFRLQEQISVISHPIFSIGNDKYGMKMNAYAGAAMRAYSSGDGMAMGQFGPILSVRANRLRLQGGYTQSGVAGKSPFVFDQFIQGNRSVFLAGDVKVSRWLTLGTNLGYNLDNSMLYQRGFSAAIGPEDLKFMISRDTISGINRLGFSLVSGSPVKADKLIMKGVADHGQLGGI
jgi:hypothetical protein